MDDTIRLDSIGQYNENMKVETLHPLISLIDFANANPDKPLKPVRINYGLFAIYLKDIKCGDIKYGCNYYDYQEGTLVFVAPGQVLTLENFRNNIKPKGRALLFHPDLIKGTSLGQHIKDYTFFSYEVNEALHLSERERNIVVDIMNQIEYELGRGIDKHSKTLITTSIELLLNYCVRFYDRQFITRGNVNKDILLKFEKLLEDYFNSGKTQAFGLPSVGYFADELNLSPNYFGDLIKKESGKSAQETVQLKLLDVAKERLFDTSKSVSEIAYELGFKYPQHFTRLFKNAVGFSPNEYRLQN